MQLVERLLRCGDLLAGTLTLDREHHSADANQRNAEHRKVGEATNGARSCNIERLAQWRSRDFFRAIVDDGDVGELQSMSDRLKKARLLCRCFEQRPSNLWPSDGQRDPGKPSARTDIDRARQGLHRCHRCQQRQAVDHMARPRAFLVDAGQVEPLVGEEKHSEIARKQHFFGGLEFDAQLGQKCARVGVAGNRIGLGVESEPAKKLRLAGHGVGSFTFGRTGFSHQMDLSRLLWADGCRFLGATPSEPSKRAASYHHN